MPWFRKMVHTSQKTMDRAKKAAVLAHLFEGSQGLELLFMKRPPYDGTHGGQISFPGGRKEPKRFELRADRFARNGRRSRDS